MAFGQAEQAVVNLVINGQQAQTSLREVTGAYNALRSEVSRMHRADDPVLYEQRVRQLQRLNDAQRSMRNELVNSTRTNTVHAGSITDLQQKIARYNDVMRNATDPALLEKYNKKIQETQAQITRLGNIGREGYDELGNKIEEVTEKQDGFFSKVKAFAAGSFLGNLFSNALSKLQEFVSGSEEGYMESVQNQAQLAQAIQSTGGVAGETKEALNDLAMQIRENTGVDDEFIGKGESILLTFTNIRGHIYDRAIPAIVDYAAALNQGNVTMESMQGAATLFGKALNDPIKGITALSKAGVVFSEEQKEQIKDLVESNRLMDAQAIVLDELQKEFGGVAKAVGDTAVGANKKYQLSIDDIQDRIGAWLVNGKALSAQVLSPFIEWIDEVTSRPLSEALEQDKLSLQALQIELDSNNTSAERRKEIIKQLKEQYPAYLNQVNEDKVKNSELLPILDKINEAFILRIAYQQRAEGLDKAVKNEAKAINEVYTNRQSLMLQLAKIQEQLGEDVINFTIKGRNEQEKATYVYKNLLAEIQKQAKSNTDLNQVLASNKYDYLVSGLNVYGNAIAASTEKLNENRKERKHLEKDLTNFKNTSGYAEKVEAPEQINTLIARIKILSNVMRDTPKTAKNYKDMAQTIAEANKLVADSTKTPALVKNIPAELEKIDELLKPQTGPSKATIKARESAAEKARKELESYNGQLEQVRADYLSIAEAAKKGTVEDLDAQLQVINSKYEGIVRKLQKLANDPNAKKLGITDELKKDINNITRKGGLKDQAKAQKTDEYSQKQQAADEKQSDDELKAGTGRIDDVYAQFGGQLQDQQNEDLNNIDMSGDPAAIEAQRLAIKELYAQKTYELEQQHLQSLIELNQTYGKDTGALEKKIADNSIKENERAATKKLAEDKKYKEAKKQLQELELDTLEQGAKFLQEILGKNTVAYKAAFIVEKAVAAARIVLNTEASIAAFALAVAPMGPTGVGLLTAYKIMARISEGLSLAMIAKQTVDGVGGKGGSTSKAAKGGYFQGPSHDNGGLDVVDPRTGETVVNVEGDEPWMVLSKETRKNNGALINQLLFNSMYRNGAAVDLSGISSGISYSRFGLGGVVMPAGNVREEHEPASAGQPGGYNELATNMALMMSQMQVMASAIGNQKVVLSYRLFEERKKKIDKIRFDATA
ncbi:hypothetical protein KHS38_12205 [Mucilaginibacter sp. Bleaf8]|uniref:hypothetical protein n=1 Tax=Mucilaginibacter sp. Bleaf8 TaxID=2834430 RepID=UPI001BCFE0D1|nr:hypothetical protein [Mucilaginibacter sp. Bleaf8]MBS7565168.1 hypothetical protein [Mucilaginibacter sp. Bleaf8]